MVVNKVNGKHKGLVITSVVLGFFTYVKPMGVLSNEMPTGGQVKSGNVTITGTGTNHMIIDSKSQKIHHQLEQFFNS